MKESILDTDIISYYLNGNRTVAENVLTYLIIFPTLTISSISYFEVLAGLEHRQAITKIKAFKTFSSNCNILNIDNDSLDISANIYGELRRNGITIGHSDLLIAGVAIKNKLCLISNNTKHFKTVNRLILSNWADKIIK